MNGHVAVTEEVPDGKPDVLNDTVNEGVQTAGAVCVFSTLEPLVVRNMTHPPRVAEQYA
jgi:hypothetical protein